ncbi:MAG: cytochrome P450, partial [Candidatus Binatia bacterium]
MAWRLLANPDPLSRLSLFAAEDGDLVHWTLGGQHYFLSRSPAHVEHVFIAANHKYRKSVHYRLLAAVTGEGLLTNEGEAWARQRKLVQPALAKRHLGELVPHMVAATAEFLDRLDERADGEAFDVAAAMSELTLDVVGRALFGATLADAAPRLRPAVVVGLNTAVAGAQFQQLLAIPGWLID